jgi:hypothetical protein
VVPAVLAALAVSVVLAGCVVDVGTPASANTALGAFRVSQGATAQNVAQTLDEYGLFVSTDRADVVAIDQGGNDGAVPGATIVTSPDVKQVRVILTRLTDPNEVGTFTVDAKKLTPGKTYYYRLYSIGHETDGTVWRTLYPVSSHVVANPTLKSLVKSKGTLSPSFSRTTYSYTNTISRNTSSSRITVVPTLSGSSVQMKIGAGSWSFVRTKLVSGISRGHSKTLYIKVTAPGGIIANYTVVVARKS